MIIPINSLDARSNEESKRAHFAHAYFYVVYLVRSDFMFCFLLQLLYNAHPLSQSKFLVKIIASLFLSRSFGKQSELNKETKVAAITALLHSLYSAPFPSHSFPLPLGLKIIYKSNF